MTVTIPAAVEELEPDWFSEVLGIPVSGVDVLDAHSGTTGRARVGLTGASELPDSVFVKLQPFSLEQRGFLRKVGLGVAEARLYGTVGDQLPVRIPHVWHAACDAADGSFVMVLEDLAASGCRFPTPADDDVLGVATSLMDARPANTAATPDTGQGRRARMLPVGRRRSNSKNRARRPARAMARDRDIATSDFPCRGNTEVTRQILP